MCGILRAWLAGALVVGLLGWTSTRADVVPQKDAAKPATAAKDAKPDAGKDAKKTPTAEAKPATAAKPAALTAKKGPFKVEVALDGVFEAQSAQELVLRPQEWSGLTVLTAIEHGSRVKRGDLLVSLDPEKIDRAIADLRADLQSTDLTLKQAEEDLKALQTLTPLDVAAAERTHQYVVDDYKHYNEVIRPMSLRMVDYSLKRAQQMLEYYTDEYNQLEKMYKADDLTEETEKIVLKRAKNQLEAAKLMYDAAKLEHDDQLKRDLPRNDLRIKDIAQRADVTWEKARLALPAALQKQRLDLEKLKLLRARNEERLNKLLADRALMTVKAPCDGIVYYGSCERGRWSGLGDQLEPAASVSPNKVFMTIVQPRPLRIRVTVPEKELHNLRAGLQGVAKPTAFPDLKLTAIVERVGTVPISTGKFDGRITVALGDQAAALMPGMNCDVKLTAYEKKDAIAVPAAALSQDETDPDRYYVYLVDKDGKSKKQAVTVGKKSDKQVEILSGLKEGEQFLGEAPKDQK